VNNQWISMQISPSWKETLVERLKNVSGIICIVDFGTSREPTDDMEPLWVPHDYKHELLLWISVFVCVAISSLVRADIRRESFYGNQVDFRQCQCSSFPANSQDLRVDVVGPVLWKSPEAPRRSDAVQIARVHLCMVPDVPSADSKSFAAGRELDKRVLFYVQYPVVEQRCWEKDRLALRERVVPQ
jgi:hypothetical protein